MAATAAESSAAALLDELDEEDDLDELWKQDSEVQEALSKGIDLREYAQEVEGALRQVERESIQDYIKESEGLAGLHTQIRQCDGVLDSMESMLRGFQTDLASISAQIKYLQDESLSMNVKLRNRKAAESQISGFIQQIVVPPDLISAICEGDVNEACALPPPPPLLPHLGRWPSQVPCRTLLPARSRGRSGPCGRTSSSAS